MPTLAQEPDLILLRRFADGDEEAFAEIVRRYAGLVFSVCRRVLGDRAWAEDVAQETFFRLMRSRRQVSQSLGGWLHRAATRLAVDALRSERSRRRREATVAAERQAEADAAREDEQAADGLRWTDVSPLIDEALAEIPDEPRDLLVRHFLGGVPQADLAAEYGTSAPTLSRRMRSAIDLLRQALERKGVTLLPSAVLPLLLCAGTGAEAAPAALVTALGKMAMISGGTGPLGVSEAAAEVPAFDWSALANGGRAASPPPAGPAWLRTEVSRRHVSVWAGVALGVFLALPYLWIIPAGFDRPDARPVVDEPPPPAVTQPATTATTAPGR